MMHSGGREYRDDRVTATSAPVANPLVASLLATIISTDAANKAAAAEKEKLEAEALERKRAMGTPLDPKPLSLDPEMRFYRQEWLEYVRHIGLFRAQREFPDQCNALYPDGGSLAPIPLYAGLGEDGYGLQVCNRPYIIDPAPHITNLVREQAILERKRDEEKRNNKESAKGEVSSRRERSHSRRHRHHHSSSRRDKDRSDHRDRDRKGDRRGDDVDHRHKREKKSHTDRKRDASDRACSRHHKEERHRDGREKEKGNHYHRERKDDISRRDFYRHGDKRVRREINDDMERYDHLDKKAKEERKRPSSTPASVFPSESGASSISTLPRLNRI